MSQIAVNIGKINKSESDFSSMSSKLQSIQSQLSVLKSQISANDSSDSFRIMAKKIGETSNLIASNRNTVITMGKVVSQVATLYKNTENDIVGNARKVSINWIQRIHDAEKYVAKTYVTGVATRIKLITTIISLIKVVYEKKGIFWKIVNTGKAVVKTIFDIAAILAGVTATVLTGGTAAPILVVIAVFAMNSIINNVLDIWNCWGGDPERVGKVNLLQESLQYIFGFLGKLIGNEEAGKADGRMIYALGEIGSIVASICTGGIAGDSSFVEKLPEKIKKWLDIADAAKDGKDIWEAGAGSLDDAGTEAYETFGIVPP